MSEPEKIKDRPPIPPPKEVEKETSTPRTSQSAFDKVMEQQKIIQQSPAIQTKLGEQGGTEQRIKEVSKWQDKGEERQKRDDRDETSGREKAKQKEKGSETVTREAVVRTQERRGQGGGSGRGAGGGKGGYASDMMKRQVVQKKPSDMRGMISNIGHSAFAGKLVQAMSAKKLAPQQLQGLVNSIVQAIRIGKNDLGYPELKIVFKEGIFSGLRLRFTSKHGKVSVQFETTTKESKSLFAAESGKIKAALEEKGVSIGEIKVV